MADTKSSIDESLTLLTGRFLSDWDGTVLVPILSEIYDGGPMHVTNHLLPLEVDTPFGNLQLSWISILQRIGIINRTINEMNETFSLLDTSGKLANPNIPIILLAHYENLIYLLKTMADRLIMLTSILEYRSRLGDYSSKIVIDSIGAVSHSNLAEKLGNHKDTLETLNAVANTYKHSFLNLQASTVVMRNTPGFVAYYTPRNDINKASYIYPVIFVNTIRDFDAFLKDTKSLIQKLL